MESSRDLRNRLVSRENAQNPQPARLRNAQNPSTASLRSTQVDGPVQRDVKVVKVIIEEKKNTRSTFKFNINGLQALLDSNSPHQVIAIIGCQNVGKSTLQNKAFKTRFEAKRRGDRIQTTKCIDVAISEDNKYVCVDMEGCDSIERDEEELAHLERMISAFAISGSNLLIYYISYNDFGTTRPVEAIARMISHYLRICQNKRRILFCIRDYRGDDENTLKNAMKDCWDQVLRKAKRLLIQKGWEESKISEFFHVDHLPMSDYIETETGGNFTEEGNLMMRLKDKIEQLLQKEADGDIPTQANELPSFWKTMWDDIESGVEIDISKLRQANDFWLKIRPIFRQYCYELTHQVLNSGRYEEEFKAYKEIRIEEINKKFSDDEYSKKVIKRELDEEEKLQIFDLEKHKFRYKLFKYFEDTSKNGHNLLNDLVKQYEELNRDDDDTLRYSKSNYKEFLHDKAKEKNIYLTTIDNAMEMLYAETLKSLEEKCGCTRLEFLNNLRLREKLNELECTVKEWYKSIANILILSGIGVAAVGAVGSASALPFFSRIIGTAIGRSITVGIGFTAAGVAITVAGLVIKGIWNRDDVWKDLADEQVKRICRHPEYESLKKEFLEQVQINKS